MSKEQGKPESIDDVFGSIEPKAAAAEKPKTAKRAKKGDEILPNDDTNVYLVAYNGDERTVRARDEREARAKANDARGSWPSPSLVQVLPIDD